MRNRRKQGIGFGIGLVLVACLSVNALALDSDIHVFRCTNLFMNTLTLFRRPERVEIFLAKVPLPGATALTKTLYNGKPFSNFIKRLTVESDGIFYSTIRRSFEEASRADSHDVDWT